MGIYKKFKWFIDTYRWQYFAAILATILFYILSYIPPWLIGETADGIRDKSLDLNGLYKNIGILLFVIVLSYILDFLSGYLFFKGTDLMGRNSRRNLVSKVLNQTPIFFEKNSTGSIMGKATNDIRMLQDMAGYGVLSFFESTLYTVGVAAIMAVLVSWKLTIVAIIPLLLVAYTSKKVGDILYGIYDKVQRAFDKLNDSVLENIAGVRVIRAFVREENQKERFSKKADDFYQENMKQVKYNSLFVLITRIFPGISYLLTFIYGAVLISRSEISLGNLISFVMYLNMLTWPMISLADFVNIAQQSSASMDRVQELLDYEEDMVDERGAVEYKGFEPIVFKDFSFKYPSQENTLLKNINLTIEPGTTIGVVGKIGSGKTTLLKQLLRLYPIDESSFIIGNRPVSHYTMNSIRRRTGYVPQQHILFSKTIRENILFGEEKSEEDLIQACKDADFLKDIELLKDGLDTLVGEKGVALSGGQKQRLSIARALIHDPEILILDDSLSAVDAKTEEAIIKNIKEKRKDKTNIIAAHRLSGIMHADEIIVLDDGEIVERGRHEDLLKAKKWYYEQFMIQQLEGKNAR